MRRSYLYLVMLLILSIIVQYLVSTRGFVMSQESDQKYSNYLITNPIKYQKDVEDWKVDKKRNLHPLSDLYKGDLLTLEFDECEPFEVIRVLENTTKDSINVKFGNLIEDEMHNVGPICVHEFLGFYGSLYNRKIADTLTLSKNEFYKYVGRSSTVLGSYGKRIEHVAKVEYKFKMLYYQIIYIGFYTMVLMLINGVAKIIGRNSSLSIYVSKLVISSLVFIIILTAQYSLTGISVALKQVFLIGNIYLFATIFLIVLLRNKPNREFADIEAVKYVIIFLFSGIVMSFLKYYGFFGFSSNRNTIDMLIMSFAVPGYGIATTNLLNNFHAHYFKLKKQGKALAKSQENQQLSQSELAALQSRVNPHFLYNSLNSIASLSESDPSRTKEMALALSDFYKYSTNREEEIWTTIPEEIEMIKKYLEVEKIRFGDKLKFRIFCHDNVSKYKIPKFLIQPLVENAVKYGYNKSDDEINVIISAIADKKDKQISIGVQDSGPDFPKDMDMGHGIRSIQKKLNLTYPDHHYLSFSNKRRTMTQDRERAIYEKHTGKQLIEPEMKIATILLYKPKKDA